MHNIYSFRMNSFWMEMYTQPFTWHLNESIPVPQSFTWVSIRSEYNSGHAQAECFGPVGVTSALVLWRFPVYPVRSVDWLTHLMPAPFPMCLSLCQHLEPFWWNFEHFFENVLFGFCKQTIHVRLPHNVCYQRERKKNGCLQHFLFLTYHPPSTPHSQEETAL